MNIARDWRLGGVDADKMFERLDGKFDSLIKEMAELKSSVAVINSNILHMCNNLTAMKKEIDSNREDVAVLKSELNSMRAVVKVIWSAIGISTTIIMWLLYKTGVFTQIFGLGG